MWMLLAHMNHVKQLVYQKVAQLDGVEELCLF